MVVNMGNVWQCVLVSENKVLQSIYDFANCESSVYCSLEAGYTIALKKREMPEAHETNSDTHSPS